MAQNVKTVQGIAIASVKTVKGIAIANVKTIQGIDNTGSGVSAFTLVQTKSAASAGALTGLTMDSAITAGNLVVIFAKCEGDQNLATWSENGVGGTIPASAITGTNDLDSSGGYKLSATGGGTTIAVTWSGSPTFTRIIVREYDYGGTASFVTAQVGAAVDNPGLGIIETADATNSGTQRLNIGCAGLYSGTAPTSPRIGNAAGSNFVSESDTHMWWTTGNLAGGANDDADCTYGVDGQWTMCLMCFAAN